MLLRLESISYNEILVKHFSVTLGAEGLVVIVAYSDCSAGDLG